MHRPTEMHCIDVLILVLSKIWFSVLYYAISKNQTKKCDAGNVMNSLLERTSSKIVLWPFFHGVDLRRNGIPVFVGFLFLQTFLFPYKILWIFQCIYCEIYNLLKFVEEEDYWNRSEIVPGRFQFWYLKLLPNKI